MSETDSAWLSERAAITDLIHDYCYAVAAEDVDAIVNCFVADGSMDVLGDQHHGHDELRTMYQGALRTRPKPFIHNIVIKPAGPDRAQGRCVARIVREADGTSGYGRYDDVFVRTADGWRFSLRTYSSY